MLNEVTSIIDRIVYLLFAMEHNYSPNSVDIITVNNNSLYSTTHQYTNSSHYNQIHLPIPIHPSSHNTTITQPYYINPSLYNHISATSSSPTDYSQSNTHDSNSEYDSSSCNTPTDHPINDDDDDALLEGLDAYLSIHPL